MVAVGVFAIGAPSPIRCSSGDINLYARNFSLNKSNNSLRYSLQMLKQRHRHGHRAADGS